jgi:predicted SAM-dependent methyltransferase
MKIQVTLSEPQKEGYFYASPLNEKFDQDYGNFTKTFAPAEVTEFYAPDFLDFLNYEMVEPIIEHWMHMLAPGGLITIGGSEPYIIAKQLISRRINLEELSERLFRRPAQMRCLFSMADMRRLLTKMGCEILEAYIDEVGLWTIKAQK